MKVPKEIKKAIMDCAKYNAKAYPLSHKIRDWFIENDISNDGVFDMFIDSVEIQGNDPVWFIEWLEKGDMTKGNE